MKFVPSTYDFFSDMFDSAFDRSFRHNTAMKTDVREKDGNYLLDIELPGYDKGDININLKNGYLTVSASKNENKEEKDDKGNIIRQERYQGSCTRSYYVGDSVEAEDIKAGFENGILKIAFPSNTVKRIEEKTITIE